MLMVNQHIFSIFSIFLSDCYFFNFFFNGYWANLNLNFLILLKFPGETSAEGKGLRFYVNNEIKVKEKRNYSFW